MKKCPSCGFDLDEGWRAKGWKKCPSCGVDLLLADEKKEPCYHPVCDYPLTHAEYVSMSLEQMRGKMMTLACAGVAIASACLLDWTNVNGLGPVSAWDAITLMNRLSLIGISPDSSVTILVALLVVFLLAAFLGAALTILGMYRFTKAPMSDATRRNLEVGLCLLGGDSLLCLVVIAAVSPAVCNQFSIFPYSTTDDIASATVGPFITLVACTIGSSLLMRDGEEHAHLRH